MSPIIGDLMQLLCQNCVRECGTSSVVSSSLQAITGMRLGEGRSSLSRRFIKAMASIVTCEIVSQRQGGSL